MGFSNRLTFKNRALEYFVVISIVVVAIAVSFIAMSAILAQARDVQRISDIAALRNALELYYLDHGSYPHATRWMNSTAPSWDTLGQALYPYISGLPRDPINTPGGLAGQVDTFTYNYHSVQKKSVEGSDYILVFRLERPTVTPAYSQQADVGLLTARGRFSYLSLTRADGVYIVRAP